MQQPYNYIPGNAHRLAFALSSFAEDSNRVKRLADPLCYYQDQLAVDMQDLNIYVNALESIISRYVGDEDEVRSVILKELKERCGD